MQQFPTAQSLLEVGYAFSPSVKFDHWLVVQSVGGTRLNGKRLQESLQLDGALV